MVYAVHSCQSQAHTTTNIYLAILKGVKHKKWELHVDFVPILSYKTKDMTQSWCGAGFGERVQTAGHFGLFVEQYKNMPWREKGDTASYKSPKC